MKRNDRLLVVIPARSGSKGIPNKNISILNGKPLLHYSIEYAQACSAVSSTYLSTDSPEYAAIGADLGVDAYPLRPRKFASDASVDFEFMDHARKVYDQRELIFDYYAILRPTSPWRPPNLIERALEIFEEHTDVTSVRAVMASTEHPYRSWLKCANGSMISIMSELKEPYNLPRQMLPTAYFQTGDLEVMTRECLMAGSVTGEKVFPLEINGMEALDIDNYDDLLRAGKRKP